MARMTAILCGVVALIGCSGTSVPQSAAAPPSTPPAMGWKQTATPTDRDRLRRWRSAWLAALAEARGKDDGAIAADPDLFSPDHALAGAVPPPGDYRCRIIKLGSQGHRRLDYVSYPRFACRIEHEGDVSSLYKIDGSQRPVGLIFPDNGARGIFLGTMMMADEQRAMQYGRDSQRDLAAVVERIADKRWRLVFPYPHMESTLDVMELVPATP
ncbi:MULTISPECIES: DUF4893 domain-containing protein [unclassified Sphingomonas]|uniref:DUF4893 domain-containing protein n=1 Tax=unclassified Sphingomonas TaxID=196159 RepID=UPI0009EB0D34|nr:MULTISPECIES: DUF4893 domain-containing protein [unclassified Sphingomonas]